MTRPTSEQRPEHRRFPPVLGRSARTPQPQAYQTRTEPTPATARASRRIARAQRQHVPTPPQPASGPPSARKGEKPAHERARLANAPATSTTTAVAPAHQTSRNQGTSQRSSATQHTTNQTPTFVHGGACSAHSGCLASAASYPARSSTARFDARLASSGWPFCVWSTAVSSCRSAARTYAVNPLSHASRTRRSTSPSDARSIHAASHPAATPPSVQTSAPQSVQTTTTNP